MVCFKCGADVPTITHHISYNPEVIVQCCKSCHKKIHNRVRKEGRCPYTPRETAILSHRSVSRRKSKDYMKIRFSITVLKYVELREVIMYNTHTGKVYYSSGFVGNPRIELPTVDEEHRLIV